MPIQTLCEILENLDSRYRKPALLRYKADGAWRDISTEEFVTTVRSLAAGLVRLGVQRGDRVALLSENRPEWLALDHAILALGAVVVPVYPTLHAAQAAFILNNSQSKVLIVSTPEQLAKIQPVLADVHEVERLVVLDPPEGLPEGALSWSELLEEGERALPETRAGLEAMRAQVAPEDLASIIYTSGTTGDPKGVMLTHGNFASNAELALGLVHFSTEDEALSFLPLSHVFERMLGFSYLTAGTSISFAESIEAVPQNISEIRPTVAASVPRLFEKIRARVLETAGSSSFVRRGIFALALSVGNRKAQAELAGRSVPLLARLLHPLTDKLVFAKLRRKLGGRLRFFISGGAPLGREVAEFFYAAGITVLEGYGLTETSPVVSVNIPGKTRLGTVGLVGPGIEVRIAEDGEILVRGPNVMQGYFRDEKATRAAIRDGWFYTGDIGRFDSDGFLMITDRKKEILKTSGGKMVAPQPIENLLKSDPFISQAMLIGDRRNFISALVAADPDRLRSYAQRKEIAYTDVSELLENAIVLDLFKRRIEKLMDGLSRFEQVKKFRLLPRELSQEEGELTPTLKIKRRVVADRFAELIDSMYQE